MKEISNGFSAAYEEEDYEEPEKLKIESKLLLLKDGSVN
jgi:hypothetical protein